MNIHEGARVASNICRNMIGTVVEIVGPDAAIVEVTHRDFDGPRRVYISLDYWSAMS